MPTFITAGAGLLGAIAAVIGALATVGVLGGSDDESSASRRSFTSVVRYQVRSYERSTEFTDLRVVAVPPATTVTLRCDGGGCFRGERKRYVADAVEAVPLTTMVPRLRPDAVLRLELSKRGWVGKRFAYHIRRRALPTRAVYCLPRDAAPVPC